MCDLREKCLHFRVGSGADSDDAGVVAVMRRRGIFAVL